MDLLENATFTLVRGRIYGLIGRNGKGKSTLLRAIARRTVGDIPPELTVHYVSQEVQLDEETLGWTPTQYVVHADIERRLLLAEAAQLSAIDEPSAQQSQRLVDVQSSLELIDADTAEERARTLLSNLGFSAQLIERQMSALSGGWRVRTALAAAIFAKPDLLLLDEPTNHLSIGVRRLAATCCPPAPPGDAMLMFGLLRQCCPNIPVRSHASMLSCTLPIVVRRSHRGARKILSMGASLIGRQNPRFPSSEYLHSVMGSSMHSAVPNLVLQAALVPPFTSSDGLLMILAIMRWPTRCQNFMLSSRCIFVSFSFLHWAVALSCADLIATSSALKPLSMTRPHRLLKDLITSRFT